jgi:non-specific serine/threonine protein kinase
MSLKGTQKDVGTIARELNVRYLLEGSVRRADNALRITAQLIDAREDSHLWAETYSKTVADIFDVQEQLSRQIVAALKVRLTPDEERQLYARSIPDVRAYEYYLRARGNAYSFDGPLVDRAIRDLNSALELLGDNVLLLRALGMAHWQRKNIGIGDDSDLDKVEDYARRIEELDPNDAGSYLLRGVARWLRGDGPGSVIELRNAYRRDRADPDTLLCLGVVSLSAGQMDVAGDLLHELYRSDPLAPLSVMLFGYYHFFSGRFDEAADILERSLQLDPDVMGTVWAAVRTLICAGRHSRARECADYLRTRWPDSPWTESADLLIRGMDAGREEMLPVSPSLRALASQDSEISQYVSDAYAFGGDESKALEWLKIALSAGFMNHGYLSAHDPFIAKFRSLPEWKGVLEQVRKRLNEFQSGLEPL